MPATRTARFAWHSTPKKSSIRSITTTTLISRSSSSTASAAIFTTSHARPKSVNSAARSCAGALRSRHGTKPTYRTDRPKRPTTGSNEPSAPHSGSPASPTTGSAHCSTPANPTGTYSPPSHPAETRRTPNAMLHPRRLPSRCPNPGRHRSRSRISAGKRQQPDADTDSDTFALTIWQPTHGRRRSVRSTGHRELTSEVRPMAGLESRVDRPQGQTAR